MNKEESEIFERLKNGKTIPSDDPQAYRLREASFAAMRLLVQMNNSSDPAVIRNLLSQITGSGIDKN